MNRLGDLVKTFRPDYRSKPHRQLSKPLAKCFPVNRLAITWEYTMTSNLITRSDGRRDVCNGTTPLLHHHFAQPLGVPLSGFCKLD